MNRALLPLLLSRRNLVVNGGFDAGTTSWTAGALAAGAAASLSVVDARLRITNTGLTYGTAEQSIATIPGRTYRVKYDLIAGTTTANIRVGSTAQGLEYGDAAATAGNPVTGGSISFVATGSTVYITLLNTNVNNGAADYDNISVR